MPLILLPLISSAFVPVDAMPGWFQPIAEYQPFTPAIETLRGLLLGTEIGNNGWLAIAWCLGLAVARLPLVDVACSTATRSNRHDTAGRLPQLVPPQGGVLRHRVGVRRPVGVPGRPPSRSA